MVVGAILDLVERCAVLLELFSGRVLQEEDPSHQNDERSGDLLFVRSAGGPHNSGSIWRHAYCLQTYWSIFNGNTGTLMVYLSKMISAPGIIERTMYSTVTKSGVLSVGNLQDWITYVANGGVEILTGTKDLEHATRKVVFREDGKEKKELLTGGVCYYGGTLGGSGLLSEVFGWRNFLSALRIHHKVRIVSGARSAPEKKVQNKTAAQIWRPRPEG